jgi:hypothetical protein
MSHTIHFNTMQLQGAGAYLRLLQLSFWLYLNNNSDLNDQKTRWVILLLKLAFRSDATHGTHNVSH